MTAISHQPSLHDSHQVAHWAPIGPPSGTPFCPANHPCTPIHVDPLLPCLHYPAPPLEQTGELVLTRITAGAGWTLGASRCTTEQLLMRPAKDGSSSNIVSGHDLTAMLFGHLPSVAGAEVMSEPGVALLQVQWRPCCPCVLPPTAPPEQQSMVVTSPISAT